jgi:excisionase family DNA binding protein
MNQKAPEQNKKNRPSLKELLAGGDLISPEELAAGMRVARVTVYQWVRRGVIPHMKIEGVVRFNPTEVQAWLDTKRRAARKAPGGEVLGSC